MSDTRENLRRKIKSASDLQSVVRTMKALTASSIGQYERSVEALADYYRTVELGLHACLPPAVASLNSVPPNNLPFDSVPPNGVSPRTTPANTAPINAIVFGSDQGLVGQFNDVVANFAFASLSPFLELRRPVNVWAVGERVMDRLLDLGLAEVGLYSVPNSVAAISPLIGQMLLDIHADQGMVPNLRLFYNRPLAAAIYEPFAKQLLPLDEAWRQSLISLTWPTKTVPEVIGGRAAALQPLVSSYVFVSLFRACAESLASENASRLAAMQRAEKNIDELLEDLKSNFHRLRHSDIDEELFEVVSGFEALGSGDF
ncbi:MAG: F0F1 ATP synthase subunit gamma [Candidatus Melainabacteria bacterium]|nr:F0F1 ATP synthase subunit gamma [Candidatus Melainabacteria bacterium]